MNIDQLIKDDKILTQDIENELRTKIKFKVNCENKPLKKIMIDFGPYPLHKDWLIKPKKEDENQKQKTKESLNTGASESKRVFLPPDAESDP